MSSVTLIDCMGSDLSVVNAARVSFDKESDWDYGTAEDAEKNPDQWQDDGFVFKKLKNSDERLIKYLAEHNHWSPFGHAALSFRIKVPIFVARQLDKHQTGLLKNEISRRYVDSPPEFYWPDAWRKRAENKKQGSSDEIVSEDEINQNFWKLENRSNDLNTHLTACITAYNTLLASGVCPEQARMVLPQSMMTEYIWTGSLYAFARVYNLRVDPHAQKETKDVALMIGKIVKQKFPVSWKYLTKE